KAIALAFAKSRECRGIVVNSRMLTEAQHVADEIKKYPRCDSIAIEADMSKEGDYNKLIEETKRDYSRTDVLVNDTRMQQEVPFEETSTEVWQRIMPVDLTGPFICSRQAVKQMLNQNPKGDCIINISSVHQIIPKPHYILYSTHQKQE
ncbi:MAG: SDR family NAD(P)-dependent oxidoreductase, partial [Thermoproteota archaeon]|nr:SDR family NAD(P)-dependent oxidoreductase [Thermoproteota archaeon]